MLVLLKDFPNAKFIHIHRDPWDNAILIQTILQILCMHLLFLQFKQSMQTMNLLWYCYRLETQTLFKCCYRILSNTQISQRIWEFCSCPIIYPQKRTSFFTKPQTTTG